MKPHFFHRAAAKLFELGAGADAAMYDRHARVVHQMDGCAVISVGNIATCGRGKSPLAQYIAATCVSWGAPTALLLRGYKGELEHSGGRVSGGKGAMVSAASAGDEAYAAAMLHRGFSVYVGKERSIQATAAARAGVRVIVLDDGFQHRKLARHLDIVSIAPQDTAPNARFAPAGPLREKAAGLRRAGLLVGYEDDWQDRADAPPVRFTLQSAGLLTQRFERVSLDSLSSQLSNVHVLSGVARPERVERTVQSLNCNVVSTSFFSDHHCYFQHQFRQVERTARLHGADAIVTTAKDLARLQSIEPTMPLFGLDMTLVVTAGEDRLHAMLRANLDVGIGNRWQILPK